MAMKLGTENKSRVIAVVVLGIVVLCLAVWDIHRVFFNNPTTPTPVAAAPAPEAAPMPASTIASVTSSGSGNAQSIPVELSKLDPTLHPEIMAQAESIRYTGSGRNIFSMNSAPPVKIEAVKGPVRPTQQMAAAPSGPPPPPPIDLQFFGYEAHGSVRKAFLLHGANIYIASEGEIVDHRYKVVKILPLSIQVTDLMYNDTQNLPLTRS